MHIWKALCLSQQQDQDLKQINIWFLLYLKVCFTYEPGASCCAGRVKTTDRGMPAVDALGEGPLLSSLHQDTEKNNNTLIEL